MLEITKIQFSETPDENREHITNVVGGVKIYCQIPVDARFNVPREIIHDRIRKEIWNSVYGDLLPPLRELQHIAVSYAMENRDRVQELCGKINKLLAIPSKENQSR